MREITLQGFLLIMTLLLGWQLQAEELIRQKQFENVFQKSLINSKTENAVLNELTVFLHGDENGMQLNNLEFFACQEPEMTVTVNCDAINQTITVSVEVTSLGSASSVEVSDNAGSLPQIVDSTGMLTFGPYPYDVDITFTIADVDDPSCNSTKLTNSNHCPPPFCTEAEPFCSDEGLEFPNQTNTGQAPDGPDYACFGSQPNPVWYYLQVGHPGDIEILIEQTNNNGIGIDVDFVMWGPFDDMIEGCGEVMGGLPPVQFSYSASATETIGIGTQGGGTLGACSGVSTPPTGVPGQIYIVMLTNYNGSPGTITLTQTGGEGSTDCSIVFDNDVFGCPGESVELISETVSELDAYVWYQYDPQADEYVSIDDEFGISMEVEESGKYKVEVFDAEGNITTENFTVIISPEPELNNLEEEMSICGVDSLILDGTVFNQDDYGGVQYRWKDEDDNVLGSSSTLEVTTAGTYTLEITTKTLNSEGVESDEECTTIFEIEINEADFEVDLGDDQILCDVDSTEITALITGRSEEDAVFTWTNQDGDVVGDTQTIEVFETGQYTVEVNIGGCVGVETINIELNRAPEFDLGQDISTCSLEDIIIEAQMDENEMSDSMVFEWSYNGELLEDETDSFLLAADYGYGNYSLVVYDGDPDCFSSQDINVNEIDDFGVELTADNELITSINYCEGDDINQLAHEITFTATVSGVEEDVEYSWYVNGSVIEGADSNAYTVVYDEDGDFEDEYTVEVQIGTCIATASLTTQIDFGPFDHPCKISEGISPNNDGFNDNLDLTFLSERSGIAKLTIYNRYGNKVYDKTDYVNDWHGQDNSGNELVTGTYYYVLELKNEDPVFGKIKKGWIYVNQSVN